MAEASTQSISRRVHRYELALRDRQAARGKKEDQGGLTPMTWDGMSTSRVNEGLQRERCFSKSLQEEKVGYLIFVGSE